MTTRWQRARRAVGLVVVTGALVGCAGSAGEVSGGEASCALAVVRHGEAFFAVEAPARLDRGGPLDGVTSGGCDDGNGADPERPEDGARRITGIDPALAFVVPDTWPEYVFVAGPPSRLTYPHELAQLLDLPERADTGSDRGRRALARTVVDRVLGRDTGPLAVAEDVTVVLDGRSASMGDGSASSPESWRSQPVPHGVVQVLRRVGDDAVARGVAGAELVEGGQVGCGTHELPAALATRSSVSFDVAEGLPADGTDPTCARVDLYLTDGVVDAVAVRTSGDLSPPPVSAPAEPDPDPEG